EIELHPAPAGVLEDAEAPRDGPVAFGQVRAELEHALGGDGVHRGGEVRKPGRGAAGGAVHGADLAGVSARVVDDLEPVPLVRARDDAETEVVLGPGIVGGLARGADNVGVVGVAL